MSRNGKNFKNAPVNFLLKTIYKQSPNNHNDFNYSPLIMKNNTNITTSEYLSFYTNENENKSNKKSLNQNKINYLFKNYSMNKDIKKINKSKRMTRSNSKTKNLILNTTNIKRRTSTSKTNTNSLNISNNLPKKFKIKEKKTNKIFKLFIKVGEKNANKTKKLKKNGNNSKKLIKNKSINNIYMTENNIFNIKKITKINNISNLNIKNKNKSKTNINYNHSNINQNNYNTNSTTGTNSLTHSSKNKIKNLSITINKIDNNINNNNHNININTYTNSNLNKNIHKKISTHKTCINTPMESYRKTEQIIKLSKELESKENEIKNLEDIINEKDLYIKNLEDKISSLNVNKNVDEEYEKYSKIIMLKNVKNLTSENEELHKQIKVYKNKEIKLMKLIENIKKKGIDINNILNMLDKEQINDINISEINNSELNTNERIIKYDEIVLKTDTTNNTNNTNNTFVPLNLNDEQKNISSKSCINLNQNLPALPLKNINEYYNDNFFAKNENDNIQIQITNNYDCNIIRNNLSLKNEL